MTRAAATGGTSASIINFDSYDGFITNQGLAAYCVTKGAVRALNRAMACDHGPEGIRVNAVWLASNEAAFATGQMFTIDGGMTAASPINTGLF